MKSDGLDQNRGARLPSTGAAPIGHPLDFIHGDHLREREICALLDTLASSDRPEPEAARSALAFLQGELPLHLEDEEEDLFPLLRRRCAPEDEIGKVIQRLSSDHRHADDDTPGVENILAKIETGRVTLSDEEREVLARYAAHARRHLILENAIILPFARLRLTDRDLETLRLRMVQRRGPEGSIKKLSPE